MTAVERLDEMAEEADLCRRDGQYAAADMIDALLATLRAVRALTQRNSTISGHPEWIVTAVPVGELLAAIDAALDVSS